MKTNVDSEPIVRHSLAPIPWRGAIAGVAASGLVVLVVRVAIGDDQLLATMAMPVLISLWLVAAAAVLRSLRADNVSVVTTAGFFVGGALVLGRPLRIRKYGLEHRNTGDWRVRLGARRVDAELSLDGEVVVALILGTWFVV